MSSLGNGTAGSLHGVVALLRARRVLVMMPALVALMVVGFGLLRARTYSVSAAFAPQAMKGALGQMSSLADQIGFVVGAGEASQAPQFYADLVASDALLRHVVEHAHSASTATARSTLVDYYEVRGATPEARRDRAVRRFRQDLTVRANPRTGVIRLEVRLASRELALSVVERILALVNEFNLRSRQHQAKEERTFVESRLALAHEELRATEDRLQAFLQRNRDFRNSPQLIFEHDRLNRAVVMRQSIVTSLAQNLEQARIDEVRNTPVLTVVEPAEAPGLPDSRGLVLKGLAAFLGAFVLIALVLVWRSGVRISGEDGVLTSVDVSAVWADAMHDFRRPWRLLLPHRGTSA